MTIILLTLVALTLYVAAAGMLARPMFGRAASLNRPAALLATLAVVAHAAVLVGMHPGTLDLHFFAALSLVGYVIAALTLLVNLWRPIAALGVIVFPLAATLLAVDVFLTPRTVPEAMEWQIKLHVAVALLAFGVLAIAAVFAILLAMQERALRHRQFDSWMRILPPLTLTEALLFRLIGTGFVLLTLTLLTGILFVENLFGQHLVHKTALSIIAWLVFGALLFGRRRYGWRGRRAVNLTLTGMAFLVLAFLGSKFVLEVVLHRAT
ncbi:MAG: cytochrome c biogenesis protein CcsA [Dokdonella sp.]|uniref:cytochrome C assembly family protein n=1 Tax=Dokdonella sp. TaxID=2291710 RepID=UPI0032678914